MPPKTVVSLLAEQPEEVLIEMRDSIRAEIERLEVEANLVNQALGRRPRRSSVSVDGEGHRLSGVRRSDVLEVVLGLEPPISPAEVRRQFQLRGVEISGAAIRNHLRRLVRGGDLSTDGDGGYFPSEKYKPKTAPDEPLFTGSQTRSWGMGPAGPDS